MASSDQINRIMSGLDPDNPKMGDVKKVAANIKKNHALALELWHDGRFGARLVAVLILDKAELTQERIEELAADIGQMPETERDKLSEWLMAHQLMKSKKTLAFLESCMDHQLPTLRRLFWYHQGRLRWTGQTPPDNTNELMKAITERLASEDAEVQWAMNFAAGWIGVHDAQYRNDLVTLGEKIALYKGDHVSPGCTPNYLPEFIAIEAEKRGL